MKIRHVIDSWYGEVFPSEGGADQGSSTFSPAMAKEIPGRDTAPEMEMECSQLAAM